VTRRRGAGAATVLTVGVLLVAGCRTAPGGEGDGDRSAPPTVVETTSFAGTTAPGDAGSLPFDPVALGAVRVLATYADGTTDEWCLLVADDPSERSRGLMLVTDPELGGYDGMVFAYAEPTTDEFWMRNTRLPLTITFVAADGRPVGTVAMDPCPDRSPSCPTYGPDAPYRWAIEVPTDRVDEIDLRPAGTVAVTTEPCAR
jgi:uncharacterized membrane protein (UPF0127 family)